MLLVPLLTIQPSSKTEAYPIFISLLLKGVDQPLLFIFSNSTSVMAIFNEVLV